MPAKNTMKMCFEVRRKYLMYIGANIWQMLNCMAMNKTTTQIQQRRLRLAGHSYRNIKEPVS